MVKKKNQKKKKKKNTLISFTIEMLQAYFNQYIFQLEKEEYQREGLHLEDFKFVDNKSCLELIDLVCL